MNYPYPAFFLDLQLARKRLAQAWTAERDDPPSPVAGSTPVTYEHTEAIRDCSISCFIDPQSETRYSRIHVPFPPHLCDGHRARLPGDSPHPSTRPFYSTTETQHGNQKNWALHERMTGR
jgi:hypothetical protein